jgi:hypothetical protein
MLLILFRSHKEQVTYNLKLESTSDPNKKKLWRISGELSPVYAKMVAAITKSISDMLTDTSLCN